MKKMLLHAVVCMMIFSLFLGSGAFADTVMPYADSEFFITTAAFSTQKEVSFSLITNQDKESIKVSSCWLQKKDGTVWKKVCDLPAPTVVTNNTNAYSASMDYSSYIGSGTYRIGFTAVADGHSIIRYSNERSF